MCQNPTQAPPGVIGIAGSYLKVASVDPDVGPFAFDGAVEKSSGPDVDSQAFLITQRS